MSKIRPSITLDEVWEKLLNGIEHLFQYQTIRYSKWMLLYTHIFDYCTSSKQCNSADLYESFRNYLRNYLENLCQSVGNLQDQDLLEFYINQWKKYRISSKILHGICSYLNRHYVRRECDSGNPDIYEIYPMSMRIWQQVVSRLFYQKITHICLNMIKSERNHQKIDTEIIPNVIHTYVTFDINENFDNHCQMLDVYQEYFENQFLADTQEFYRLQATTYLQQHSVIEYLSKIQEYIDEEIHRVTIYLHPSTIIKLIKKLEEVFIHDQLIVLNTEAKKLINDENISELNLLYRTVNRIENGKIELKNILENHIYQISIQTIEHINPIPTNDLKIYIQTIYDLHQKYLTFIQKTFDNDQEFIDTLDRTCRKFVNDNAVIHTIGNMTIMAEHLARNCDKLLRKGRKEEIDLEIIFNQITIMLFYMQEKDVFGKFYSKLLSKRLINQMSISNDYEKLMISNIQNACGFEYTYKMKQMCQDIETSKNILDQYYKSQQFVNKINFNVLILNSNAWLFSIPSNIILSNEFEFIFNNFNKFYNNLSKGRKLIWLHQYSKGELQTFFTDKMYTLQVSMYQMMILLLFNNSLELTIEKIHDETQIKIDLLLQILNSLLQSKILISTQITNLDMNSIIKLSNDFTSDKYHINLNIPMKSIEQNDAEIFHKKINQDRIMVIQAAIVRIMKLHKTMNYNLLIQTVIEQLNSHFNPNVSIIKDCINILIKKEYLERSSNNKDLLFYMS